MSDEFGERAPGVGREAVADDRGRRPRGARERGSEPPSSSRVQGGGGDQRGRHCQHFGRHRVPGDEQRADAGIGRRRRIVVSAARLISARTSRSVASARSI